jgi:hypothetical protein
MADGYVRREKTLFLVVDDSLIDGGCTPLWGDMTKIHNTLSPHRTFAIMELKKICIVWGESRFARLMPPAAASVWRRRLAFARRRNAV